MKFFELRYHRGSKHEISGEYGFFGAQEGGVPGHRPPNAPRNMKNNIMKNLLVFWGFLTFRTFGKTAFFHSFFEKNIKKRTSDSEQIPKITPKVSNLFKYICFSHFRRSVRGQNLIFRSKNRPVIVLFTARAPFLKPVGPLSGHCWGV